MSIDLTLLLCIFEDSVLKNDDSGITKSYSHYITH
jgi:hypothetical protein